MDIIEAFTETKSMGINWVWPELHFIDVEFLSSQNFV
jgi:hypothetical protein